MLINLLFRNGEGNGKVIRNLFSGPSHHQKLTTFRESPLYCAYHVWSTTSINALSCSQTERQNEQLYYSSSLCG